MNNENISNIHWSFWAVGAVSLIWNVLGVMNFFAQMNPEMLAAYRESERAIVEGRPARDSSLDAATQLLGAQCGPLKRPPRQALRRVRASRWACLGR